ncbi:ABC-three component system middle component 6 [Klebsiella pneumoniae]
MLLPKDIHPKDSLYYNGGFIIDTLKRFDEIELIDLFTKQRKKLKCLYQFLFYLLTGYT